jgi:hypothetical protein
MLRPCIKGRSGPLKPNRFIRENKNRVGVAELRCRQTASSQQSALAIGALIVRKLGAIVAELLESLPYFLLIRRIGFVPPFGRHGVIHISLCLVQIG